MPSPRRIIREEYKWSESTFNNETRYRMEGISSEGIPLTYFVLDEAFVWFQRVEQSANIHLGRKTHRKCECIPKSSTNYIYIYIYIQIRNVYGLRVLLTKEEIDRRLRENIDVANQEYKEKHVGVDLHEKIASKRAETMKEGSIKQIGGLFREIIEEGSVRFLVKESDIMPYNDIRPKEEVLEPIETENFEEFQSNYIRYLEEQGIQKKKEADREQRKIQAEKERIEREAQEAARHAEAEAQGTGEGVGNQGEVTGEGGDNRGSGSGEGDNQGEGVDNQGTGAQGENLTQEENLDTIKTIEDPQPPTSTTQEEGKKEGDQIQPPLIIGGSPSMDNIPLDHTTSFVHDLPPPFQVTLPHNLLIHQV